MGKDRRDTDAIASPIDPGKIVWAARPLTPEEVEKVRWEHKAKLAEKKRNAERRPE